MAGQEAAAEEEPKKKTSIVKIVVFVLGGLVLVALGAGAGFFYVKMTAPPVEENPLAIVIDKGASAGAHGGDAHGGGEKKAEEKKDAHGGGDGHGGGDKKDAGPAGKAVPSTEQFATTYFEFPGNFTTNLRGSKRFVQLSLGLSTQYDKQVIENAQKHEVAIRGEVLALLADQSEADMVGIANRRKLQEMFKDTINKVLTERAGFGGIESVFITALVMQ
jgi:flagellar FliL protein